MTVHSAMHTAPTRYRPRLGVIDMLRYGAASSRAPPAQHHLRDREDEDEPGEHQREGGPVAELQEREGVEVDVEHRGSGLVQRLAGGHQEELVEGEQRADDA